MIPRECKRLAEVDFPIAEASQHAAREKSIDGARVLPRGCRKSLSRGAKNSKLRRHAPCTHVRSFLSAVRALRAVSQRTRELGIRLALGAGRARLMRQVIAGGMSSVVVGIVAGLLAAALLTRLLSSFLFGVSAVDPATFAVGAALLSIVALFACLVPTQRAARVDPIRALRCE